MNFLPFEHFSIVTSLSPAQAQERLEQEVSADTGFSFNKLFSSPDKYFSGYVANGTFEIKRIINYRNSFLPVIKGSIEFDIDGSRIQVKMQPHILVIVFMCIWLSGTLIGGLAFLTQQLHSSSNFDVTALMPFGMFIFGYLLAMGGFKYEVPKARIKLVELLGGSLELQDTKHLS